MTIHGLDYRATQWSSTGRLTRLWPLAANELRGLFRSIWGMLLYGLCALPLLGRMFMMLIYLGVLAFDGRARRMTEHAPNELRAFVPTHVDFYLDMVVEPEQGALFFFMILTAFTAARAIAKDRATNALELYWTRGISPLGYFAAKWFGCFLLIARLFVGGPLLIWLTGVLLAEDWSFLRETVAFVPGVALGLTVFVATLTAIAILVSAVAGAATAAMMLWCLLLALGTALGHGVTQIAHRNMVEVVSVWDAAGTLARWLAGAEHRADVATAATTLAVVVGALSLLVWRRLRVTEAVA